MHKHENRWLVLEGDWGGQIFLTCPVRLVPGLKVRPWNARQYAQLPVELREDAELQQFHDIVELPSGVRTLLAELDAFAWGCNKGGGTSVHIHTRIDGDPTSDSVIGGMGGGELTDGLWLHEEFSDLKWRCRAVEMLGIRE